MSTNFSLAPGSLLVSGWNFFASWVSGAATYLVVRSLDFLGGRVLLDTERAVRVLGHVGAGVARAEQANVAAQRGRALGGERILPAARARGWRKDGKCVCVGWCGRVLGCRRTGKSPEARRRLPNTPCATLTE